MRTSLSFSLCSFLVLASLASAQSAKPVSKSFKPAVGVPSSGVAPASAGGTALLASTGSDNCGTPDPIGGTGTFLFNNLGGTTGPEGQQTCNCTHYGVTPITLDVWFLWTASFTGVANVSTCGVAMDLKLAVYAGSTCPAGPAQALNCDDDFCAFASASQVDFTCVNGQDYLIQIGVYPASAPGSGNFIISQVVAPPPLNDNCGSATAISGGGAFAFDLTTATTGSEGQCEAACLLGTSVITQDVWFSWTAGFTGQARANMCATVGLDTKAAVYAGAGCPTGPALSCDDDACGGASASQVVFNCVAGNVYTLQMGLFPGSPAGPGSFVMEPFTSGAGDDCATPIVISGPGPHVFDNTAATTGSQGQMEPLCLAFGTTAITTDIWYEWTAPCTGTTTLTLCAGTPVTYDSKIAAYAGAGCPSSAAVGCDDDFCAPAGASEIVFPVTNGQTYTLQIGTFPGQSGIIGTFDINTVCTPPGLEYCAGDGVDPLVTTACPCLNFGGSGRGCASSFNANGAHITATGETMLDNVVIQADGLNATGICIFIKGTADLPVGIVFGDGIRCADGTLVRRTKPITTNTSRIPLATDALTLSTIWGATQLTPPGSGILATYLVYYRNAAVAHCPPETFNASNGYQITW